MPWLKEWLRSWLALSRSFSKTAAFPHPDRPRPRPEDDRQSLQTAAGGAGGAVPCLQTPFAIAPATFRSRDRAGARSRLPAILRLLCAQPIWLAPSRHPMAATAVEAVRSVIR